MDNEWRKAVATIDRQLHALSGSNGNVAPSSTISGPLTGLSAPQGIVVDPAPRKPKRHRHRHHHRHKRHGKHGPKKE